MNLSSDPEVHDALTRHPSGLVGDVYAFGQFRLIPSQRSLLDGSVPVRIGSRALDLLTLLVERAGEVISKEELLRHTWPNTVVDEAGLRVHIAGLRKALGESHSGLRYIANVPLRGYCFVVPVSRPVSAQPALSGGPAASNAVPPRLTRLIGREEAVLSAEATLLQRRFVTLVGPGGMGKTSVALACVERCASAFEQGACFVDLAGVADASSVPGALAAALGVQLATADATSGVLNWLGSRQLLIVLDNCEHVVDAAALLAERLIGGASRVSVLATSREPLRARGEWVQRLNSLASPPLGTQTTYEDALAYPAFELFVERAMASLDGLSFGDTDVSEIARLCRSLDGMPLALELVAARVGMFGLRGLVERLDDHLSLPTLGHRTALPRHQGLRATMDWSYGLLSTDEQRLLRRLSAFRERFTLEAASAVAAISEQERLGVTPLMMNLVAKSLVVAEPGEDMVAYRLLQTTSSYAAERLAASGELDGIRRRHAVHCLSILDTVARDSEVLLSRHWRERHGRRIDDLRAALDWAFAPDGDVEIGVALLARSPTLWFGLSLAHEYMRRLDEAPQPLPPACSEGVLDMQLCLVIGQTSLAVLGATDKGHAALERALRLAATLQNPQTQIRALWSLFSLHSLRGDYVLARDASEALGVVAHKANDLGSVYVHHRTMALCLHCLGDQAAALQHVRRALTPEAVALQPAQGTLFHLDHRAAGLTQLARILWLQGQTGAARAAARDAMQAARDVDHPLSLTYALSYAACPIALWCGENEEAGELVALLQACVDDHQLSFWQSWPPLFRRVLAARAGASPLDGFEPKALHFSHVDILPTLLPGLVDGVAMERVQRKANVWSAADILRVQAETVMERDPAQAHAQLMQALDLARGQGAFAWALRCASSLARMALQGNGEAEAAGQLLQQALADVDTDTPSADVASARALLAELAQVQRVADGPRASQASARRR